MQDFFKQFTIIDFLAMFIPGGCFILLLNAGDVLPLTKLCTAFFGENGVALSFYFVILSYLTGSLLHECGKPLEKLLRLTPEDYLRKPKKGKESQTHRLLREKLCGANGEIRSCDEAYSYVKIMVQGKGEYQKRRLFSAFYGMSRTMLVTIPLTILIFLLAGRADWIIRVSAFSCVWVNRTATAVCNGLLLLLTLLLLGRRTRRFRKLCFDYAFQEYLCLQEGTGGASGR